MAQVLRKTKIVCTMGPKLFEKGLVKDLIEAGMDMARFNFSHGTHESHLAYYQELCRLRETMGRPVATMLDTKGPEIRTGLFENGRAELKKGQIFIFTTEDVMGNAERTSVSYKDLPKDVKVGTHILIDDGLIDTVVESIQDTEIHCRVINGGPVSNTKGINVPGIHLSMPFLSAKDEADIHFAIDHGFDFIAASFTRSADDIMQIRRIMAEKGCTTLKIIAKIENMEGIENIDEILRVVDALMVARGDMGVEIPFEEVPGYQKMLIRKCVRSGKPVITATQMLDSMMHNPRPTRAEATDVANAIYDGTSAIMLSGETAAGDYPVEAVKTMVRIARTTEANINFVDHHTKENIITNPDVTSAISHATVTSAHDLKASAIITVTKSGQTARTISKYRPACTIVGCTTSHHAYNQLALSWGVVPLEICEANSTDELFERAVNAAKDAGLVTDGEVVVLTAGVPLGISGTTNMMKVHVVGHLLCSGTGVCGGKLTAPLCVVEDYESAKDSFHDGDLLVARQTDRSMLPLIRKAGGIILEDDDIEGHGVIAGMSLDIPVMIGVKNATEILKTGAVVKVNIKKGTISAN